MATLRVPGDHVVGRIASVGVAGLLGGDFLSLLAILGAPSYP